MYAGKVELCGVDTARLPVLSEAEKSRLIKAARAGDRQARQEMVQGNLRLVLSVVQRFAGRGGIYCRENNGIYNVEKVLALLCAGPDFFFENS